MHAQVCIDAGAKGTIMKEIVSSIYHKYPADKKTRPCLHPIVQLIEGEWRKADTLKRDVS